MSLKDITLLCLTLERQKLLLNSAEYWNKIGNIKVVYADGSKLPCKDLIDKYPNIKYIHMLKKISIIFISIFLLTLNANAGSDGELKLEKQPKKVKDCFETLNRATFAFNQGLDKAIIKPLAEGYRNLPDPIQKGTHNFVTNLSSLVTIPNNILQGDIKLAIINTARLAINSTAGILGTVDVANKIGFPKYEKEDYGQTLACLLYTSDAADE